jgi:drug/metabolite transporter (DMT)-like permease
MRAPLSVPAADPDRLKRFVAFFLVYVMWGTNFLAIRYAVQTLPPFVLMGVRCLLAGSCLYVWARLRGDSAPTPAQWRAAAPAGLLLFLLCHGLLAWSQRHVTSGVAALTMATIPAWMTVLDWIWARGPRPRAGVWIGIALGLAGLAVLATPSSWSGGVSASGLMVLLVSAFGWAAGSIVSRASRLPSSVVLATGMQLLIGGLGLIATATVLGELGAFDPAAVSVRSWLGFLYMVGMSSIVVFTAYVWLLRVSTPARVGGYAFANPLVAVLLGWAVGGEPLTACTAVAALLIVAGVATIVTRRER